MGHNTVSPCRGFPMGHNTVSPCKGSLVLISSTPRATSFPCRQGEGHNHPSVFLHLPKHSLPVPLQSCLSFPTTTSWKAPAAPPWAFLSAVEGGITRCLINLPR